jgi:hypothetical protein
MNAAKVMGRTGQMKIPQEPSMEVAYCKSKMEKELEVEGEY